MKRVLLTITLVACIVSASMAAEPLWQGKGRIAISSDGNEHDDDDWSATPFSLAMLYAAGIQDKLSLYTYSDHIWGSNQCYPLKSGMSAYDHMKESALVGKALFNFDNTKFICAVDNAEVAYAAMVEQINLSTETNPLIIIGAGPMQVIGEAMNRSNKEELKYVTLLSHSYWNNFHSDQCHGIRTDPAKRQWWDMHEGWTWDEMKEAFEGDGVKFVKIADQNGKGDHEGLYCKIPYYDWVKTSPARDNKYYKAGSWDWLYSRLEVCIKGVGKDCYDPSDAGMIIYLLTGEEDAKVETMKNILENPGKPKRW